MSGPLWLIGMMGAGKTTVAPLVAGRLGWEWFDTDREVESSTGRTVADLFEESESAFRSEEQRVVRELAERDAVVAAGGGVVTHAAADVIAESGFVIWLNARTATLVERVGDGQGRPLLADGAAVTLQRLLDERDAAYRTLADASVETDGLSPHDVAEHVVAAWERAPSKR